MRQFLVFAALVVWVAYAELPPGLQRMAVRPDIRQATIAVKAVYVEHGATILRHNAGRLLLPASNQKLLTSAAALDGLNRDRRFVTRFSAQWDPTGAVLTIVGGGDPVLSHHDIRQVVKSLRARGLPDHTQIRLDLSRYDTRHYGPGWRLDDVGYYYEPPILSLAIGEDAAKILATPGKPGEPPKLTVEPPLGFLTIKNEAKTGKGKPIEVTREADRDVYTVTGFLPTTAKPRTLIQKIAVASVYDLASCNTA